MRPAFDRHAPNVWFVLLLAAGLVAPALGQNPAAPPAPAGASSLRAAPPRVGQPTLEEYHAQLRKLFALGKYDQLLQIASDVDKYYPGQEMVAYYRSQSQRKIAEAKNEETKNFHRLRDRPPVIPAETPGPTPAAPKATPPPRDVASATVPSTIQVPTSGSASGVASPPPRSRPSLLPVDYGQAGPIIIGLLAAGAVLIVFLMIVRRRRSAALLEAMELEEADTQARAAAARSSAVIHPHPKPVRERQWEERRTSAPPKAPPQAPVAHKPEPPRAPEPYQPPEEIEFETAQFTPEPRAEEVFKLDAEEADESSELTPRADKPKPQPKVPNYLEDEKISIGGTALAGAVPIRPEDSDLPQSTGDVFAGTTLGGDKAPWETGSDTQTDVPRPAKEVPPPFPQKVYPASGPAFAELDAIQLDMKHADAPEAESIASPESWETEPGFVKPKARTPIGEEDTIHDLGVEHEEYQGQDTQTTWDKGKETTHGLSEEELSKDPDLILPPAPGTEDLIQVFHQDETAQIDLSVFGRDETAPGTTPIKIAPAIQASADTKTSTGVDSTPEDLQTHADPFDKARQLGFDAFAEARWDQAVHHLSVAAALRPEAADVKEKLRQARRMRKN